MDGGVDEDGVDELVNAHVLQHLLLVLLAHIAAILHISTAHHMRLTTCAHDILPASSECIGISPDPCNAPRDNHSQDCGAAWMEAITGAAQNAILEFWGQLQSPDKA